MTSQIAKWGNSLALRIPKSLAAEVLVQDGDPVDVSVEDGALVIRPARKRYTIEELVADITPDDRHGETDWGRPRGKEIW
ncbi:MAG: AbrB/MazE/SpoVT family DNA-binding domain-containing protein [Acidobacteria bacterium]|nr:AbrB/MazE/SpoVT family DNA-binding domain-containing protein [Acidobacteriota bacterium]